MARKSSRTRPELQTEACRPPSSTPPRAEHAWLAHLQRTAGNKAVRDLLSSGGVHAAGRLGVPPVVQRYADFRHPSGRRLFVSENWKFLRPADGPRELWTSDDGAIVEASKLMEKNDGIVTLSGGEMMSFLQTPYRRVVVEDRPRQPKPSPSPGEGGRFDRSEYLSLSDAKLRGVAAPMEEGAGGPFDFVIKWLGTQLHEKVPLKKMIMDLQPLESPWKVGSYESGSLAAIKIQLALELDKQITQAAPYLEAMAHLTKFMVDWKSRVAVVNSEAAHKFNFMCVECGGFSKMVMGGGESDQSSAATGDRMKMKGLETMPGPWQNHYAAVIMTDGGDRATLESAAGMDEWWFGMYGDQRADQTFVAKTLVKKFELGIQQGEALSQECLNYTKAKLAGDEDAADHWRPQLNGLDVEIDKMLAVAYQAVEKRTRRSVAALEAVVGQ